MTTMIQNSQPTSIQQRERLAFVPRDFDDAWRQAEVLSKVGIFPDYLRGKPHDILCTIITGAELGLSPMQSVRDIVVVKGKGFIQSKLKVALVKQQLKEGEYFRLVTSSATSAVYETKRSGEGITRYEYTMDMARTAGKAGDDQYQKRPAEMLRARCSGDLCEIVWSDVTRGIGSKEDLPAEMQLNSPPAPYAPPAPEVVESTVVAVPVHPPQEHPVVSLNPNPEVAEKTGVAQAELLTDESSDLAVYAAVKALCEDPTTTEKQLDELSPRAQRVKSPVRSDISSLFMAKRKALRDAKAAK